MFLLGGGAEEACFEEFLKWSHRGALIGRLRTDSRVQVENAGSDDPRSRRLQVAAGLAFPVALWPKQFLPSQVERVSAVAAGKVARPRPDRDELYPK